MLHDIVNRYAATGSFRQKTRCLERSDSAVFVRTNLCTVCSEKVTGQWFLMNSDVFQSSVKVSHGQNWNDRSE